MSAQETLVKLTGEQRIEVEDLASIVLSAAEDASDYMRQWHAATQDLAVRIDRNLPSKRAGQERDRLRRLAESFVRDWRVAMADAERKLAVLLGELK